MLGKHTLPSSLGFVLKAWNPGLQKLTGTVHILLIPKAKMDGTLQATLFVTAPHPHPLPQAIPSLHNKL